MRRCSRFVVPMLLMFVVLAAVPANAAEKPRLVVVVSVDQLAWHVLQHNHDLMPEDGFFRHAEKHGATFSNCHHRHAFTFTGPGHAVLLSGAYPNQTGVVGNEWFDPARNALMYCVECDKSRIVDGLPREESKKGAKGISPGTLGVETLGDVIKAATGGKGKVYGVSFKDRAGVLMAGKKADAAFWFTGGKWVTSDYYVDELPRYVRYLNDNALHKRYAGQSWELLIDEAKYDHAYPDDAPFEADAAGLGRTFPHKIANAKESKYEDQLPVTPFANELTLHLARVLISEEKLGVDDAPDVLAIGLSANDYIGHAYGPNSLEVQDVTLRTDRELAKFVEFLDEAVGAGKWVLALTADHGICPIPEYLQSKGIKAKRNALGDVNKLRDNYEALLVKEFGPLPDKARYVLAMESSQVYLTRDEKILSGEKLRKAREIVRDALAKHSSVFAAVTKDEALAAGESADPLMKQLHRTCHATVSGDVLFVMQPHYIPSGSGTTHGSPWDYDTHVPLVFLGAGISAGQFNAAVSPANISPTLAVILGVKPPAQCVAAPLEQAVSTGSKPVAQAESAVVQ